MKQGSGNIEGIAIFLKEITDRKASAQELLPVFDFLEGLDVAQRHSQGFFHSVRLGGASGGIKISTRDSLNDLLLLPRKGWLKVSAYWVRGDVEHHFDEAVEGGRVERLETKEAEHFSWRVKLDQLGVILRFLENLPCFDETEKGSDGRRTFPVGVRQAALGLFRAGGNVCCGADYKSPHKVINANDFEFDHRLPFVRKGESAAWNIQVMCKKCNRKKSDKQIDWLNSISDRNV